MCDIPRCFFCVMVIHNCIILGEKISYRMRGNMFNIIVVTCYPVIVRALSTEYPRKGSYPVT